MRINFIVPRLRRRQFTGGILCIFEYAHGLVQRGHDVTIVPMRPSGRPEWFPKPVGTILANSAKDRIESLAASMGRLAWESLHSPRHPPKAAIRRTFTDCCLLLSGAFETPIQLGIDEAYARRISTSADVTLATSFETARVASMFTGAKFYFIQHFEPYFRDEYPDPVYAEWAARQSYKLGLNMIANSSWLRARLQEECPGGDVSLCPNAIDHSIFCAEPRATMDSKRITLISYGGRTAKWKGFGELVEAVAIARREVPDIEIEWKVFGDALIGADNPVAPYKKLGLLASPQLAEEYRRADILVSASWYESFPLFPIEAMACGLAVVTTQFGTEEYATHGDTAEIVMPKSPRSIADGIIRLIKDPEYRQALAKKGQLASKNFTWQKSVEKLEKILSQER